MHRACAGGCKGDACAARAYNAELCWCVMSWARTASRDKAASAGGCDEQELSRAAAQQVPLDSVVWGSDAAACGAELVAVAH